MHATLPGQGRDKDTKSGKNILQQSDHLSLLFPPCSGQTAHRKNIPCRPLATGINKHRNKQNTCTQQIRLRKRPLQG